MATIAVALAILILSLCISRASTSAAASDTIFQPFSPVQSPPPLPQPQQQTNVVRDPAAADDDQSFIHTALILAPILSHLGYTELAMAVPSLSSESTATAWSGPSTLFAPSDASLHSCCGCSVPNLLREHIVPGLFTVDYLRKLAFGTKVETLTPGRCLTVTSSSPIKNATSPSSSAAKVFIGGVEITSPDLFNNGFLVIHGIQGSIAPLSPFSCDVERLSSLTFHQLPGVPPNQISQPQPQPLVQPAIMRLMMQDAILRLRNNGFSHLALAMQVKYPELVTLTNMTIFAIDDFSIFSGSYSYISSSVRFHIIPNQLLTFSDLERLPVGCTLPTLETGHSLVVTTAASGGSSTSAPMRINYARIKLPDVIRNLKIAVHGVYRPFPMIEPTPAARLQHLTIGFLNTTTAVVIIELGILLVLGGGFLFLWCTNCTPPLVVTTIWATLTTIILWFRSPRSPIGPPPVLETQDLEPHDEEAQVEEAQNEEAQNEQAQNEEIQNEEIQNEEAQDDEAHDEEAQNEEAQDEEAQDDEAQDEEAQDDEAPKTSRKRKLRSRL